MVRDGYIYSLSLIAVAVAVYWLTGGWAWSLVPVLLAAFFLWFFRDPTRTIPTGEGLIVSPGDGLVTETVVIHTPEGERRRRSDTDEASGSGRAEGSIVGYSVHDSRSVRDSCVSRSALAIGASPAPARAASRPI